MVMRVLARLWLWTPCFKSQHYIAFHRAERKVNLDTQAILCSTETDVTQLGEEEGKVCMKHKEA